MREEGGEGERKAGLEEMEAGRGREEKKGGGDLRRWGREESKRV